LETISLNINVFPVITVALLSVIPMCTTANIMLANNICDVEKDAKNKDAAKAFIDFVVSEDGQKLAAEIGYTPIRTGVEAPEGLKTISDLTVISAPVSELIQTRDADKLKFKEMFGE